MVVSGRERVCMWLILMAIRTAVCSTRGGVSAECVGGKKGIKKKKKKKEQRQGVFHLKSACSRRVLNECAGNNVPRSACLWLPLHSLPPSISLCLPLCHALYFWVAFGWLKEDMRLWGRIKMWCRDKPQGQTESFGLQQRPRVNSSLGSIKKKDDGFCKGEVTGSHGHLVLKTLKILPNVKVSHLFISLLISHVYLLSNIIVIIYTNICTL